MQPAHLRSLLNQLNATYEMFIQTLCLPLRLTAIQAKQRIKFKNNINKTQKQLVNVSTRANGKAHFKYPVLFTIEKN